LISSIFSFWLYIEISSAQEAIFSNGTSLDDTDGWKEIKHEMFSYKTITVQIELTWLLIEEFPW